MALDLLITPYIPGTSPIHRLEGVTRLGAAILLAGVITAALKPLGLTLALIALLLAYRIGQVPLRLLWRSLLAPLPFILILAVIQIFLRAAGQPLVVVFGILTVTSAGLWSALVLLLRFCALVMLFNLASFCLSSSEAVQALEQMLRPFARLGLPVQEIIMTTQVTLNFLPFLAQTAQRIAKAQAARGADWDTHRGGLIGRVRLILPFIVPLFLITLRRAENMALAMEGRAFDARRPRSVLHTPHFSIADGLAWIVVLLAAAGILYF